MIRSTEPDRSTEIDIAFLYEDRSPAPPVPADLLLIVDGKFVRASIDWATLRASFGSKPIDAAATRDFIRRNRRELEIALEAHLLAHGVPLDGHLILTADDLRSMTGQPGR